MAEFLSREWIAELDRAARASDELRTATSEVTATVQQVVPDAPGGTARYHVTIDRGDVHLHFGPTAAPDLTLRADYHTARAINEGITTAQRELASGRLEINGGMAAFVGHERALAAIGDVFGSVRADTTYTEPPENAE